MSNSNRIAKNTFFLYIRMALSMIVSLYTVRVVLQVLGVEDYGIYSAVGGIVSALTIFTGTLSTASQRFFSIEIGRGDRDGLNQVFNSILLLYLFAGILVLIIAETAGVWFLNHKMIIPDGRVDASFIVLQCTLLSFFISVIISPFQAIIIAKENMKIYAYVGVYDVLVKLLIAYLLQLFQRDKLILYSLLLLFASISAHLIYFLYTILKYREIKLSLKWEPKTISGIINFSGWSFIGSLAFLCNAQGLNLLMNVFFGPIVNAAYNIGSTIKNAVTQLGANFFVAVRPSLIKEYASENFGYVCKLFYFSTKVIFVLLFVIMFPIAKETEGILSLWLGEVGDYMVSFVRLMLLWALLLNISDPITTIVQAANKVKDYHLKVDLFTLLSLPIAYFVFKLGANPNWAFIISVLVLAVAHIIRLFILRGIVDVSISEYLKNVVMRMLCAMFLSFILSVGASSFFVSDGIFELLIKIVIDIIVSVTISYMVVFDAAERMQINTMVKGFINKMFL